MRRRALPIAAVALAGLLLGLWLAWPEPLPPIPETARTRAQPPPPALPSPAGDTGYLDPVATVTAPRPPVPTVPELDDPPSRDIVDRLDSGVVRCRVDGGRVTHFTASLIPSPELMKAVIEGVEDESTEHGAPPHGGLATFMRGLYAPLPGRVDGDVLVFEAPTSASGVFLQGDQEDGGSFHEELALAWTEDQGRCVPDLSLAPQHVVQISGLVRGLVDGEQVIVHACRDATTSTDMDGRFELIATTPAGPCRVTAWRRDGALRAYADFVDLDIDRDERFTDVTLTMPADDIGGMGARIQQVDEGVLLVDVGDGSPGSNAGLRNGEVVTAVNGESLAGLPLDDAIATITGPVGSYAVLTVIDPAGEERDVEMRRDWIEGE